MALCWRPVSSSRAGGSDTTKPETISSHFSISFPRGPRVKVQNKNTTPSSGKQTWTQAQFNSSSRYSFVTALRHGRFSSERTDSDWQLVYRTCKAAEILSCFSFFLIVMQAHNVYRQPSLLIPPPLPQLIHTFFFIQYVLPSLYTVAFNSVWMQSHLFHTSLQLSASCTMKELCIHSFHWLKTIWNARNPYTYTYYFLEILTVRILKKNTKTFQTLAWNEPLSLTRVSHTCTPLWRHLLGKSCNESKYRSHIKLYFSSHLNNTAVLQFYTNALSSDFICHNIAASSISKPNDGKVSKLNYKHMRKKIPFLNK